MGAKKDMLASFSSLTQEEVLEFCEKLGIDPSYDPLAPGLDRSIDRVLPVILLFIVAILSSQTSNSHFPSLY